MKLHRLIFLAIFIRLTASASGAGDEQPLKAADIPTSFRGSFEWMADPGEHGDFDYVTLHIDKVEEKDGLIQFTGWDYYSLGKVKLKIHGTIDPKTRQVKMWESEPSREGTLTDGSFEGKLSPDLKSMDAIWTTRETGKQGNLRLKRDKPDNAPAPPPPKPIIRQIFPQIET